MRTRLHLWAALPLALLALGAAPRSADANILCDLGVSDKSAGQFGKQIQVRTGQVFFLRIAVLNASAVPVVSVCDIPGLRVSVGRVLMPFSVKSVLLPKRVSSTTIAVVAKSAGTTKTTLLVRFLNPFTGRVHEISDSVVIISGPVGDDKKGTTGTGGKDDKKGGTFTQPIGELGGAQQTGGTGGQQTGGLGGQDDKKDGALGGQQTGGTGGQTGGSFIF